MDVTLFQRNQILFSGNVMTFNLTGLTSGTTYFFNIRAVNDAGTGPKSETVTMKTGKCDISPFNGQIPIRYQGIKKYFPLWDRT